MSALRRLEAVPSDIPEAPYPSDVRANGWKFELDLARAKQSTTWIKCPARLHNDLIRIWSESWLNSPAGTWPADDDELIAAACEIEVEVFIAHRAALMRQWFRASDGRLYHPVLVELVERMRDGRKSERVKKARQRAEKKQQLTDDVPGDSRGTPGGVPGVSLGCPTTGSGTGDISSVAKATDSSTESTSARIPDCRYEQVIAAYHEHLPSLPRVKLRTESRERAMRKVWKWVLTSSKSDGSRRATTADEAIEWFRGYFRLASSNDFLLGRSNRPGPHANWTADLDFLLTERGMRHVIEKTVTEAA